MNRCDFKKEIHEYIDMEYVKFCSFQEIVLDIYIQVSTIAIKHSIPLFLAYGSLLGIVRDSNFLPWDSDIDTFVLFDDAKKLIDALKEELSDEYFITSNLINKNYRAYMTRICKKGYNSDAIHVDIFYAIQCSDEEKKQALLYKESKRLFALHILKHDPCRRNNYTSNIKYYFALLLSIKGKITPQFLLDLRFRRLFTENSNSLLILAGEATKIINRDDVFPGKIICKNGVNYYLCENPNNILKELYGDYMQYMDIDVRFNEFYRGICYLNKEATI